MVPLAWCGAEMNTPKELEFDKNARVLYLPGYCLSALALIADGRGDLMSLEVIAFKIKHGTLPPPKDIPEAQKSGIIRPYSRDGMWLLNPRNAYAELEKELIP